MPYYQLKPQKTLAYKEVQHSKCIKFGKTVGKNPQLCPFTGLTRPIFVIPI